MEMKSISGYTCLAADIEKTAAFYDALGFRFGDQTADSLIIYLNWFSVRFIAGSSLGDEFTDDATAEHKGAGIYINVKVEDVDAFYKGVLKLGLKPSSEPRDWPWGNREFVLRDSDGYKLVFWAKR